MGLEEKADGGGIQVEMRMRGVKVWSVVAGTGGNPCGAVGNPPREG